MHFLVVGLSRELSGKYQALAEKINASGIPVLAVDYSIRHSMQARGQVMGTAIRANRKRSPLHTVSLGSVCTLDPSMPGHIQVKDVGIYGASEGHFFHWITKDVSWLPVRDFLPATKELSEKSC